MYQLKLKSNIASYMYVHVDSMKRKNSKSLSLVLIEWAKIMTTLKSPGNIIVSLQTLEYMFLNNKIFFLVTIFKWFISLKNNKVVWGGDSAYPFCDVNRGRLCLDWTSNTRSCKYMKVLVVSLYASKKFILHFSGNADQMYCCWTQQTTKDGVSLQSRPVRRLFQHCAANTFSAVVLRESGIHYTFWHE